MKQTLTTNVRQAKIEMSLQLMNASRVYRGRYMHSGFKALGATMKERTGTVDSWVRAKSSAGLDQLITDLGGDPATIEVRRADDFADR